MKILVLTRDGTALGLAQRLTQEGHQIEVFSDTLTLSRTGNDIYDISKNLWKSVQECKFIVTDTGDWAALYKRAKTYNKPIIGCSEMTDMLNKDYVREYKLCKRLNINMPETEIFSDAQGLQPKVLSGKELRYVIKHNRTTFLCDRSEWMAWAMYQLPIGDEILLQKDIKGKELSIIGWFNGLNWVRPFFYATPNSEKIGAVTILAQKKTNKLTKNTIEPLEQWLRVVDYKGAITVKLIIEDTTNNIYVDSFDIGLSAPAIFAIMEGLRVPLSEFLNSLAFGNAINVDASLDYLLGIEVKNKDSGMLGAPILGLEKENLKHVFLHGVFKEDDSYMISGETTPIYTAVARGQDIREAARRVYRTIEEVQFPRMHYLPNITGQSMATFQNLKSWSAL